MSSYMIVSNAKTDLSKDAFSRIDGILVEDHADEDAAIRYVLKFDNGDWCHYADGKWFPVSGELSTTLVLKEGNTSSELSALTQEDFAGLGYKEVSMAAVIRPGAGDMPQIKKFEFHGRQGTPFVKEFDLPSVSIPMEDSEMQTIYDIDYARQEAGGHVELLVSLQSDDGTWSDYQDYKTVLDGKHKATGIRFRGRYSLDPEGKIVKINQITVSYQKGDLALYTGGKGVFVTKYHDTKKNLHNIYLSLKHDVEDDVTYEAFVSFMKENGKELWRPMQSVSTRKERDGLVEEQFEYYADEDTETGGRFSIRVNSNHGTGSADGILGTGTGSVVRYSLPHHALPDTIHVMPEDADWTYDDEKDALEITAPAGVQVSAKYDWTAKSGSVDSMICVFNE